MRLMGRLARTLVKIAVAILAVIGAFSVMDGVLHRGSNMLAVNTAAPASSRYDYIYDSAVVGAQEKASVAPLAERPTQFPDQIRVQMPSSAAVTSSGVTWAQISPIPLVLLMALPLIGVVFIAARVRKTSQGANDEVALLHGINEGLQRMEQRIEALETLVVDNRATRPAGRP